MAVYEKSYTAPEAQFERRYGMLVLHGHVADFVDTPDTDTCNGWMERVNLSSLEADDAAYSHGSLETLVRQTQIGSSVIQKSAISAEVNEIARSRSADRLKTRIKS